MTRSPTWFKNDVSNILRNKTFSNKMNLNGNFVKSIVPKISSLEYYLFDKSMLSDKCFENHDRC